ncbi:hypothetical protein ACOSQ2_004117 [Xanthoceras sorbifolium]
MYYLFDLIKNTYNLKKIISILILLNILKLSFFWCSILLITLCFRLRLNVFLSFFYVLIAGKSSINNLKNRNNMKNVVENNLENLLHHEKLLKACKFLYKHPNGLKLIGVSLQKITSSNSLFCSVSVGNGHSASGNKFSTFENRFSTSENRCINETIFQETDAAATIKEIRRRDPYAHTLTTCSFVLFFCIISLSLPDFVAKVQEAIKPALNAYMKSQGIFFDNKILHISEVEVRETKMMGSSPIIIVAFQTQQVYCVRDRQGAITEGEKDTIHTVYYAWAMQQVDAEELGEGALYPIWKLREMQQLGIRALI